MHCGSGSIFRAIPESAAADDHNLRVALHKISKFIVLILKWTQSPARRSVRSRAYSFETAKCKLDCAAPPLVPKRSISHERNSAMAVSLKASGCVIK